ncbi:MAG: phosphate acetyltransferase [Methylomonas sp.]|nr:phosphate acetyltransferase [Methylomonas sp.]PPD20404.1 MAG: phosphate acetyltransferase [Methylomonas sp.]PPD25675.1 MAG: phosphate acetyltransferase [Methylomonas sp.]PPD36652.1 MAG: phosphate acetyltransferase [Methylomonas sp.]PPD40555.1 MAG: phosphate acetyltransferase [Methylomonas sp.]
MTSIQAEPDITDYTNSQNIYIVAAGPGSGKSVIMLAMMEMLSGHVGEVGFFRPIVDSAEVIDPLIEFVAKRYQPGVAYDAMYGCTSAQAHALLADDHYDELLKTILGKYRALARQYPVVLCVGSDYRPGETLHEFDFNAVVANNLDCLLMPVMQGMNLDSTQILNNLAGLKHTLHVQDCEVLAAVINGVAASQIDDIKQAAAQSPEFPVFVVPAEASLEKPTMANVAHALNARIFAGNDKTLSREVYHYRVAAMLVPDFLDYVQAGDLIITPGDRSDIILASLMTYHSSNHPQIAGLLLTGHQEPGRQVQALIEGLGDMPFAVLGVDYDTFATAMAVSQVSACLHWQDKRRIAKALGLVENHIDMTDLRQRLTRKVSHKMTPLMFEYELLQRAKARKQHIVLPEGSEERILRAAEILLLRDVVKITLLGNENDIRQKIQNLGLKLPGVEIIDPMTSGLRPLFAEAYYQARKHKHIVYDTAYDLMGDYSYFGTLMVQLGFADGMVSGAVHSTQHTIRPAFEIIKTKPGVAIVSSVFFMCLEDEVLVYADCAVNPNPDATQLADIAISAAQTAQMFNIEPRIAMLSYSTGDSGKGEAVDKVREAVKIAKALRPDLQLEGPMQYDAAVDASVAKTKLPDSQVAGRATVFIFPDLNTGNNTYKAVQRSSGAIAVGPILQGLNKPVNDLSRGCTVPDIVNTIIITAIQAQENAQDAS